MTYPQVIETWFLLMALISLAWLLQRIAWRIRIGIRKLHLWWDEQIAKIAEAVR